MWVEFDDLNKEFIYSFVLQHPENRIVIPIINPRLFLVAVYKVNNNNVVEKINNYDLNNVNFVKKYSYEEIVNKIGSTWEEIRAYFNDDNLDYKNHGIIVYNKNGDRLKIRSKNYEKIKMLKGNT